MTVIDLLIDPLAAHPFKFWNWIETGSYYGIPFRNFLGWFVVSVVIFSTEKLIFRTGSQESYCIRMVGFGIMVLYTICAFTYGYYLAVLIGIGLCLAHWALARMKTMAVSLATGPEEIVN